ncbi:MAG: ATP-binding cassette domain-containing protein [Chloroflexi bacterium]|nr:ATP-binding cassette domain-containing protein [Chloroflexota bacterium]
MSDQGSLAVETRDLWFSFSGGGPVLRGVDLDAARGQVTVVLGASGSGKTTLLKLLKGLLAPQRGSIRVLGRTTSPGGRGIRLDAAVAYIPQNLGLVRNLTVLENTLTGALGRMGALPALLMAFPPEWIKEATGFLERLGIAHKLEEKVYNLSGGERQRVAIARALMQRPQLLLADEFVSQLDPVTTVSIMDSVRETVVTGLTVIMTTHELDVVARYADHVAVLRDGQKVLDLPAAEVNPRLLSQVIKV